VIKDVNILSPIVFHNSRETKMHDSLPLELFSLKTLDYILHNPIAGETMIVPWCLLVLALTLPELSTRARLDLLMIGFWMLFLYENPDQAPDPPSDLGIELFRPMRCDVDKD
jgi:hypothetical protein